MPDFGDGARWIVGEREDQDRDAARAVTLVHDLLILDAFEVACAFLDGALDVLLRHRCSACAVSMAVRSRGLPAGSPPPIFAAIVISRMSLVKCAPRFASVAAL